MASTSNTLKWSAQLRVAPSSKKLVGDKIILPQSALEALLAAAPIVNLENGTSRNITTNFDPFNPYSYAAERDAREAFADRQQQLPHPLTFRLMNPSNGRVLYAGIREFSADNGEVQLSSFLREALGLKSDGSQQSTREGTPSGDVVITNGGDEKSEIVTIHHKYLSKGTYVRLRPLEAGYDPEDWKSLLERYLRDNFTTLTLGGVLDVGTRHEHFRFLVDKFEPEEDGICIVDTDLEVDIEALNEDQARETLQRLLDKRKRAPGTQDGSSAGGNLQVGDLVTGQVLPGEYVDYQLNEWDRQTDLEVMLDTEDETMALDVLINPMSARQQAKPRVDEHVFADFGGQRAKRMKLSHRNVEVEGAGSLAVSIHAWRPPTIDTGVNQPLTFSLQVAPSRNNGETSEEKTLSLDEVICKNCQQHIPKRTLPLHEAFCYRNNISCPKCKNLFLRRSEAWANHRHCPHDDDFANSTDEQTKHDSIFHPQQPIRCPSCEFQGYDLPILAQHRTSTCPGKEILCQFCHLIVPQQGADDPSFTDAEVLLSGLTPHELADGARTTECHICSKIVRLRDMQTHLRLHDRERVSRPKPICCVNDVCKRTITAASIQRSQKEQLGLCDTCFGPLYNSTYDPEGKGLRRRTERRLLQQLMGGCAKSWCQNQAWCRTGHKDTTGEDRILSAKDALPMVKPILEQMTKGVTNGLKFCVDESTQSRRLKASILADEGLYQIEWCIKALEETKADINTAQNWLQDRAPKLSEVLGR